MHNMDVQRCKRQLPHEPIIPFSVNTYSDGKWNADIQCMVPANNNRVFVENARITQFMNMTFVHIST